MGCDLHHRPRFIALLVSFLGDDLVAGCGAMDNEASDLAQLDEDILTFDVQDDALERAGAVSGGQAVTIGYCTHWYHCNWPL